MAASDYGIRRGVGKTNLLPLGPLWGSNESEEELLEPHMTYDSV